MGFSKDNFEQYRQEIRIMWRVLAVGAVFASGVHILSLPWVSRMVSGVAEDSTPEIEAVPIEILVEEEVVQQTPEPEPEPDIKENTEPAAAAEQPSAAPLATNTEPLPLSEVAAADTVAVAPAIATENGTVEGEGAVGDSAAVGLVPGTGQPTESGDRINLPDIATLIEPEPQLPRTPVQETSLAARRAPSSRTVSCSPCSLPEYPTTARREEIEGQPVINAIFDENGRVIEAEIEVSSGNAAFDQAALEEARNNWRFQDSQGLGGQVSVDVVYVIDDSEQYEEVQQAGEIRAVELPVNQQVQSITPDEPSPVLAAPASTPSSAPSIEATPPETEAEAPAPAERGPVPAAIETEAPESDVSQPSTQQSGTQQPEVETLKQPAPPAVPDIAPSPAVPVPAPPPEPAPLVTPAAPALTTPAPPDISPPATSSTPQ
ncbi:MAG: TonB family protein [Phormidesmis sp.]